MTESSTFTEMLRKHGFKDWRADSVWVGSMLDILFTAPDGTTYLRRLGMADLYVGAHEERFLEWARGWKP